jgi:hypothetical protein
MVKSLNINSILTEKMQGFHWHDKGFCNGYAIKIAVLFRFKVPICEWNKMALKRVYNNITKGEGTPGYAKVRL